MEQHQVTDQPQNIGVLFSLGAMEHGGQAAVRQLTPKDWENLRDLRLNALQVDGEFFGPLYENEKKFTKTQWQERCTPTKENAIFGLFREDKLIGMVSAKTWGDDPTGKTVLWCQAYLKPEYRGKKLAANLYEARLEWSKQQAQYHRAVFFIHEKNKHSQAIHEKNGATLFDIKPMTWPGRPVADWHWYEKKLSV